jgi:DNA polymerase III alpha subunit (gram-positive type)
MFSFAIKGGNIMSVDAISKNQVYASQVAESLKSENTKSKETDDSEKVESESEGAYVQDTETAAVYEKSSSESVYDDKTIQEMLSESNLKAENFKKLFESLLNRQSEKFYTAFPKDSISEDALSGKLKDFVSALEVDDETKLQAQEDISEDGYYGVKQTSDRILSFAKALAGDDPDKLEEMYSAVEKGFKDAQKMWGDDLPEICSETLKAVQQGFDDWRNELSSNSSDE